MPGSVKEKVAGEGNGRKAAGRYSIGRRGRDRAKTGSALGTTDRGESQGDTYQFAIPSARDQGAA